MIAKGMTINDAAHIWVAEMNAYPQDIIQTLMQAKPEDWHEVTMPKVGDRVYVFNTPTKDADGNEYEGSDSYGEITEILDEGDKYIVEMDDGTRVRVDSDEMEVDRDGCLPMWGWLWSFGDSTDDYWMNELDGIKKMSECGFRIYEHEEWGYFFGIDGCGYSFYEAHWIPAYKARGLQWHDPATELTNEVVRGMLEEFLHDKKLIDNLLKMERGETIKVGGYYGGFIKKEQAQKVDEIGWFNVKFVHDTVQEMSSVQDNNYYIIRREV